MNNNVTTFCRTFCAVSLACAVVACQSAPEKKAGVDVIAGQHIEQIAADLKILMEKQQQHDQLLMEWQQLKPAVSRLVVIEEELNLMINQLDQFVAASAKVPLSDAAAQVTQQPATKHNAVSANQVSSQTSAPVQTDAEKRFALQITSLSEPLRLPVVWEQLKRKHPQQLAALEPNYEKISVGNSDYYRLKIGAYSNKQQAAQSCTTLKAIGINCLVTNYTVSDFSQLPRP